MATDRVYRCPCEDLSGPRLDRCDAHPGIDPCIVRSVAIFESQWTEFFGEQGCQCCECGRRYRIDLNVPDEVWSQIGMPAHAGLLCGSCIIGRMEILAEQQAGFGYLIVAEGKIA